MNYCERCMWGDKCSAPDGCDHFDPLDEDHLDIIYDLYNYYKEWMAYIKHNQGGDWDNY